MKTGKLLLASFSLLAFAGAPAYADQARKDAFSRLDENADGKLSRQEYQQWGSANAGAGAPVKASLLIGKAVVNRQGEPLGEIKDVVIDLSAGTVHAAVLEFGGILGMREKNYAFPVSHLQRAKDTDKVVLAVDKEKLENAQGFAKGQWPAMNDEYWGRVGGQRSAAASAGSAQPKALKLVRASDLIGKEVHGRKGDAIGEIEDLTLSLKDAAVQDVVVDVVEAGRTPVEIAGLATGTDGKLFLDMTHDELKRQAQAKNERQ